MHNGIHAIGCPALLAVVAQNTAVKFQYPLTPRLLVESINILCDHRLQLAVFFQLGQLLVSRIGLGVGPQHLVPVKAVKFFRPGIKKAAAEDRLRRIIILLVIKAICTAEIRDTALCTDACTAEENDMIAFLHPFAQRHYLISHHISLPSIL